MYLKLSSRKRGEATEIAPEDVEKQTQGLEDYIPTNSKIDASHIHMQLAKEMFEADDKKKGAAPVMIERSWRVSPEEFIVKIDASPLHQSAARRMFDKNKPKGEEATTTTTTTQEPRLAPTAEETEPEPSEADRSEWGEFWDNMTNLLFTGGSSQK